MSVGSFAIPVSGPPTPPANVLHEYTTGGTWTKPTDASFRGVWVFAAGAGGSGGAGGVSGAVFGASGGGGGATVRVWIPEASLGATETYAIGAGAAGPASGNGSAGGDTLFGLHVEAKGGNGGVQGAAANPAQTVGGSALSCTPVGAESITGGPGGRGRREVQNSFATPYAGNAIIHSFTIANGSATNSPAGGAGGGGGGGYRNTTATGTDGGDGGGVRESSLTAGGAGGAFGGSNGTAGVDDIYLTPFLGLPVTTTIGLGTGGGAGGGASGATAGGSGANGGRAAGGGGGGSTESGTRGAGGDGGDGYLIVYEVYEI